MPRLGVFEYSGEAAAAGRLERATRVAKKDGVARKIAPRVNIRVLVGGGFRYSTRANQQPFRTLCFFINHESILADIVAGLES